MTQQQSEIEKRYGGKPIDEILKEQFAIHGSVEAVAKELGVSQGTISLWMKEHRLKIKKVLVKVPQTYRITPAGKAALAESTGGKQVG